MNKPRSDSWRGLAGTVLLVDDDAALLDLLELELHEEGIETVRAESGKEAFERVEADEPSLVVLDLTLPDTPGEQILETLQKRNPNLPVVILTARHSVEAVVECMQKGATDFIQKPFDRARLIASVRNGLTRRALDRRVETLADELRRGQGFEAIVGGSPAVQKAVALLRRAAENDVTVLLMGESGTGKEVAARAIHAESERRRGPFVAVNCSAIPETLIEAELFGHDKGAFTGAIASRPGRFELADGGTIFLDEIGELRTDLQVKLLRVLQERKVQRIGSSSPRAIDVRVIAATNRNLKEEAKGSAFREDLYYRLAVFPVTLPPLRERAGDVDLLARTFVTRFGEEHGRTIEGITPEASRALQSYGWPGNVRELENVIERAIILEDGDRLSLGSLSDEVVCALEAPDAGCGDPGAAAGPATPAAANGPPSADDIVPLEEMERRLIIRALELTGWNVQESARRLGIGRATIYRKIERYGIPPRPAE